MRYGDVSLWLSQAGDLTPRPALSSTVDADVAIVGAGFTGLWTAYYLERADPGLRIVVLEKEIAGYGASGRNGGWASALFPASRAKLAALPGSSRESAQRMTTAMRATVDEIGHVVATEGIDCGWVKGGTVTFARSRSQVERLRREVAEAREWGDTEDDLRLLSAPEAERVARVDGLLAASYTPHCARIQPALLARGLAACVERQGTTVYEQTEVTSIGPGLVTTRAGRVRADVVVRATEAFTAALPGMRRTLAPVYSLIVATEPLPAAVWSEVGLDGRPTFTDGRHLLIYGQRTVDDRLAFGGRGAPYHFGSRIDPRHDRSERVFQGLRSALVELFPAVAGHAFTHSWGGAVGVPRDWTASVGFDRETGIGWAGGYVGDGVSTTNLAGRTLADLVTGRASGLTRLPWVNHRSRRWEPEPLRWLGVNAGLRATWLADREEALTGRESLVARALGPLHGGH